MIKKILYILLIVVTIALTACSKNNCPDKELSNFNLDVNTQEKAIEIFKTYFSEEKGYTPFNESYVIGPNRTIDANMRKQGDYVYYTSNGANEVIGYLYKNGRLVQKGNCK